jgi:hypothetical protein
MSKATLGPCDANAALANILTLRRDSGYQAAELLRQQQGAEWMAEQPQDTQAYGAVRLLIGTWESIAMQVLAGCPPADGPFFDANPVGYMWDGLKDGIKVIRDDLGQQYASNFESLNKKYRNWLKKQTATYQTGALDGINAQFG